MERGTESKKQSEVYYSWKIDHRLQFGSLTMSPYAGHRAFEAISPVIMFSSLIEIYEEMLHILYKEMLCVKEIFYVKEMDFFILKNITLFMFLYGLNYLIIRKNSLGFVSPNHHIFPISNRP